MQTKYKDEMHRLERELAYSAARSDIEVMCECERHSGPHYGVWFDTQLVHSHGDYDVRKAVRYLELRGLIKRHPVRPELVSVLPMHTRNDE